MNKYLINSFIVLFSIFLLVRNGLLIFLSFINETSIFLSNIVLFVLGGLLLFFSLILNNKKKKKSKS